MMVGEAERLSRRDPRGDGPGARGGDGGASSADGAQASRGAPLRIRYGLLKPSLTSPVSGRPWAGMIRPLDDAGTGDGKRRDDRVLSPRPPAQSATSNLLKFSLSL